MRTQLQNNEKKRQRQAKLDTSAAAEGGAEGADAAPAGKAAKSSKGAKRGRKASEEQGTGVEEVEGAATKKVKA